VSTSSARVRTPRSSSPNSNFVSASSTPFASATADAASKIAREVSRSAAAVAPPTRSTTTSKGMFSSWAPSSALNAAVKMGSGRRSPSCSPAGSGTPLIDPTLRYSA
jgi:hypothetical protein